MKEKMRIDYFDIAKGIAILTVILGHCGGIPQWLINFIFSFHMPVFFFASGYFLKKRDSRENAVIKAKQLMVPYIVTGIVIVIASTLQLIARGTFIDDIYVNILNRCWAIFYGSGQEYQTPVYVPNAQALWFFPALFFALILVHECIKRKYSAIYVGVIALIGYYTSTIFWVPLSLQAGMVSTIYVYIGYEFKKYNLLEYLNRKIVAVEIFVIYILYYLWGGGRLYLVRNWFEQGIWEIAGSLCGVLCLIKISQIISGKVKLCKRILSFIGRNTQLILCFHIIDLSIFDWTFIYNRFAGYGTFILFFVLFILRSIWAIGGMLICRALLRVFKGIPEKKRNSVSSMAGQENTEIRGAKQRNVYIDVSRGLAILLMVYAHYAIDPRISTVIFSFHMPIFILISGYFYRKETTIKITLIKTVRGLIMPYMAATILYTFISSWHYVTHTDISIVSGGEAANIFLQKIYYGLWGISNTSTLFQNIESVGPIWFIVCLASVRIMYALLSKIFKNEKVLSVVIGAFCITGYLIGRYVAFLPWSLDVGMVSLAFFHIGFLIRKVNWLEEKWSLTLALFLVIVWVVDIHYGGLDLAARNYAYFPVCIIGAIAGSILVLKVGGLLAKMEVTASFLSFCGRHSMLILCIHSMEQRTCAWASILPDLSANIVFLFRIMIILMYTVLFLCTWAWLKNKMIKVENVWRK